MKRRGDRLTLLIDGKSETKSEWRTMFKGAVISNNNRKSGFKGSSTRRRILACTLRKLRSEKRCASSTDARTANCRVSERKREREDVVCCNVEHLEQLRPILLERLLIFSKK